ncbi:MAG: elongation factor-1 alpha [Betaproteobacteria bacterium]|nr:elongation factor-1 alpha [Betaproteobacteria bacterium]
MKTESLHQLYTHYSELPYSQRVLYTCTLLVLGSAYLFALIYLFHSYSGRDGNPGDLTYEDVVVAYTGSGKGSRLESALRGPMATMLPAEESSSVIGWVGEGASQEKYEQVVRPIMDKRCMSCHDGSNPHLPNLGGFDNIKKVIEKDTGTDIFTLVRVSHIHLFGLTFVFFIIGLMFSHAYLRPVWLKCGIVALPFVCLVLDVSSWYFTKLYHPFGWVVMVAGGGMGMSFAFMWCTTMYQLWFYKLPATVARPERTPLPPTA